MDPRPYVVFDRRRPGVPVGTFPTLAAAQAYALLLNRKCPGRPFAVSGASYDHAS